jgi:hypothetical protein
MDRRSRLPKPRLPIKNIEVKKIITPTASTIIRINPLLRTARVDFSLSLPTLLELGLFESSLPRSPLSAESRRC